ncbi:hypothetical protein [Bacillus altitudinis]|nr:hypothetical protein [Bacillus altitudinis]
MKWRILFVKRQEIKPSEWWYTCDVFGMMVLLKLKYRKETTDVE